MTAVPPDLPHCSDLFHFSTGRGHCRRCGSSWKQRHRKPENVQGTTCDEACPPEPHMHDDEGDIYGY